MAKPEHDNQRSSGDRVAWGSRCFSTPRLLGRTARATARFVAVLACALAFLGAARPAAATWSDATRVLHGSAYTLDQGSFALGVLTPLQYGVIDQLTVFVHPVLLVLVTPNLGLRVRLLEKYVTLGLGASYQQNFLYRREGGNPGSVTVATTLSVPIGWRVVVSVSGGYSPHFFPARHRVLFSAGVNVLAGHNDLILVQAHGLYAFDPGELSRPAFNVMYAHAFGSLHVGGGVSIGRFAVTYRVDTHYDEVFQTNVAGWPIYPFADVWWHF